MCLAIPGQIIEFVDEENQLAKVEIGGVRRNVNIGLLDRTTLELGDYVLVHVGFAMSRIDAREAEETLRLLAELAQYHEEVELLKASPGEGQPGGLGKR
ncbi:MAG: HypC/HybG/HupF family hydrogenase formation chaperone [Blastocatellia bacterium]|nr:HypC/HybG/HupF family hydrogenase formation chaperone [Blastocatellia bacterium]